MRFMRQKQGIKTPEALPPKAAAFSEGPMAALLPAVIFLAAELTAAVPQRLFVRGATRKPSVDRSSGILGFS